MVRFIGMVGQPRRNFMEMASWSRASEHLVNPIGISDQLKWNNQEALISSFSSSINGGISILGIISTNAAIIFVQYFEKLLPNSAI